MWFVVGNAGTGEFEKLILKNRERIADFVDRREDAFLTLTTGVHFGG